MVSMFEAEEREQRKLENVRKRCRDGRGQAEIRPLPPLVEEGLVDAHREPE